MIQRLAALLLVTSQILLLHPGTPAAAQDPDGTVSLESQSTWVGRGGDFDLRLKIDRRRDPDDLELAVTLYPTVTSRSEFGITLDNKSNTSSLTTLTFPVSSLRPDPTGAVVVRVPIQDASLPRESRRVSLGQNDGVHPVRVDLRDERSGDVIDRFTTHLVHLPADHPGPRLGVALILPLHLPLTEPDGSGDELEAESLLRSVEAARGLPATLAPTPGTLGALAASSDERASEILDDIRGVAAGRAVVASPYVPVDLPALSSVGLQQDADAQLDAGTATLAEVLRVQPDAKSWLSDGPLDGTSLAALARRGVGRLVVNEPQLEPVANERITPSRPFVLAAGDTRIPTVAADGGLATHFENQGNQVLRAHQLLADLAVLYLDEPGAEQRALVALPRRSWVPDRRFVETVAAGLTQNPLVEPTSLDGLFASAPAARSERSPLVRRPASRPGDAAGSALGGTAADLRATRRRLDSLGSVLGRDNPALAELEHHQLLAESSELRSREQRQAYVEAVEDGIAAELADIRMPEGRSITLTARRGEIPVTFQNRTGFPAQVIVRVESDKLDFPTGTTRDIQLTRRNTIERFAVVAKTSGAFPLRITLESPDRNLVIGEARLTVRSTAAARVSLFVSLGAAGFLALWWGRHALRGRRSRRLVNE